MATKIDIKELEAANKQNLLEMELRLTLRFGAMLAVAVTAIKLLDKLL